MFQMTRKFYVRSLGDQIGSPRTWVRQMLCPGQSKEVEAPVVHPNALVSGPASASEVVSVDMRGVVSAGSCVEVSVGAPEVAFVDTSEAAYAGILAVTGGHWGRHPLARGR